MWSLRKSTAWEFQQEWRLMLPGDKPKQVAFPKHTLKEVVLGYRFKERDFAELKAILIRGGYQVEFSRIERVSGSFNLATIYVGEIPERQDQKANAPKKKRLHVA